MSRSNSKKDSLGNTLTAEQQEFFKDSKVRYEDGNLLVCSHNSFSKFTEFDVNKIGKGLTLGKGFYFFDNIPSKIPKEYGNNQYICYLYTSNKLHMCIKGKSAPAKSRCAKNHILKSKVYIFSIGASRSKRDSSLTGIPHSALFIMAHITSRT